MPAIWWWWVQIDDPHSQCIIWLASDWRIPSNSIIHTHCVSVIFVYGSHIHVLIWVYGIWICICPLRGTGWRIGGILPNSRSSVWFSSYDFHVTEVDGVHEVGSHECACLCWLLLCVSLMVSVWGRVHGDDGWVVGLSEEDFIGTFYSRISFLLPIASRFDFIMCHSVFQ